MPNYSGMTHYPLEMGVRGKYFLNTVGETRERMRHQLAEILASPLHPYMEAAATGGLLAMGDPKATQRTLDAVAMHTGPLGDMLGPAADAHRFAYFPEERTPFNMGLSALGAMPFVPHLGGVITDIKTPLWNRMWGSPSVPIGVNPSRSELQELFSERRGGDLRALIPKGRGDSYFWPADAALHQDIGSAFNLNPRLYQHGLLTPDDF